MVDRNVGQRIFHRVTVTGQRQQGVGLGYHLSLGVKDTHGKRCLPLPPIVGNRSFDMYDAVVCGCDL